MKRLFGLIFILLLAFSGGTVFSATPPDGGVEQPEARVGAPDANLPTVPDQEPGAAPVAEVQISTTTDLDSREYMDEHVLAVKEKARARVEALAAEIEQLADRGEEAELQKKIEKIKLDAEIARLHIQLELVRDREDQVLAAEIEKEISHLETIDEPVIGTQGEQPEPESAKINDGGPEVAK